MTDIRIWTDGVAGRITLTRADALNALTWEMCLAIEAALDQWRDAAQIAFVVIDAEGDKAFCAGGDIALMYETTAKGDHSYGQQFWRDEYRLNAKLFEFPKPVVSFLQGYTMGGGVGVGCHASHRIVCETSKIALPECTIGLIPDVGGTLWLARAPGRLGEFLGVTGDRMDASDAIYAGFADYFIPYPQWPGLIADLCRTGDLTVIDRAAQPAPPSRLAAWQLDIDATFGGERLDDCIRSFDKHPSAAVDLARKAIARNAPLSMWVAVQNIHKVRAHDDIRFALETEFRFTYRSAEQSDFIEGIRAAIIDKDRNPKWQHDSWDKVTGADILQVTRPLPKDATLTFEKA